MRIRKLTPLETERLQGWSLKQGFQNHTKLGLFEDGQTKEISNSQRYKMCGNGISSPVSKHTLESFINEPVRVLSLFSGAGGTELLLDKSRFKLVGNCENDKYAQSVLRFHHPKLPLYPDVTELLNEDLPEFDLLTFGYPCQDVSVAGKGLGIEGERSSLVFHVIELIKKHKPKYIMAENVKNHLSKKHVEFFLTVMRELSKIGYALDFQVLNTKNFGLPQNRERLFILGKLND